MVSMRKVLSVVIALFCVAVLSSCHGALPFWPQGNSDRDQADARMEQIAAAVNAHDAAALKALFSPGALEKATDIDERIDSILSFFPNGMLTWESDSLSAEGSDSYGTELLKVPYKVSADGEDFWVVFADFTVNEVEPDKVGLYGLGVTPWIEDRRSGPAESLFWWAGSIDIDESNEEGYPGIYAGYDNSQMSLHRLPQVLDELKEEDNLGLKERFTQYAQAEHATEIEHGITELYSFFPGGDVVAPDQQDAPVVREKTDNGQKQLLLLSTYRVSAGGTDYWLFCADFRENSVDPSNLGIYAIGVAPWTESGDSPAEQALFAWADSFDVDASAPPGILISQ